MVDIAITNEDIDAMEAEHNAQFTDAHKQWQFDEERRNVIRSWDDVQACPGSGKTTLVAAKLLILAKKWTETHKGICVLTHTNVARDEIVERLHDHPSGFKLTAYPHFIGTIQQFINTFLALPYARSRGWSLTQLGDHEFSNYFDKVKWRKFRDREKNKDYWFSYYVIGNRINMNGFYLCADDGCLSINPKFMETVERKVDLDVGNVPDNYFIQKKEEYLRLGICQFRDAYAFSSVLIHECEGLVSALRNRFPLIIIDEMQDTQESQDQIIQHLFDHEGVALQRLGDPDQAIFDNIGEDGPNKSYNGKDQPHKIRSTHRFGDDICEKIIGLSYNRLDDLSSARNPERGEHPHTIFLYDDASRDKMVLEAFGKLVAQVDPDGTWNTIKAVGGVEGSGAHISQYWNGYDRSKSSTSPKPKKLIHIAHICKDHVNGHVSSNHDLLMQGVLDLLRKAERRTKGKDGRDVYFSRPSLNAWLREKDKRDQFRKLMSLIVLGGDLSAKRWGLYVGAFKKILEIDALTAEASDYLSHDDAPVVEDDNQTHSTNIYTCANGRKIEVGTIHSVKGETHDATLVLETKFDRYIDVKEMLAYVLDETPGRPAFTPNSNNKNSILAQFMRKLYVAASRPRHLLCIAMHKDHITQEQIEQLESQEIGWKVKPIMEAGEDGA